MAFTPAPTVVAGQKIAATTYGNKESQAITELQQLADGFETGPDNAGPTSGTTPLTIDTFTFPTPTVTGRLHIWSEVTYTKSASGDRFQLTIENSTPTVLCTVTEPNAGGATIVSLSASGVTTVNANTSVTVNVILVRASGAGTATVSAGSSCVLHYIFIPTP